MKAQLGLLAAAALLFCAVASAQNIVLPNLGGMDPSISTGVDTSTVQSWPDVVGMDAGEAKALIEREAPGKSVYLVPMGSMVTMDWRPDRVRVFYDTVNNKVADVPRIG